MKNIFFNQKTVEVYFLLNTLEKKVVHVNFRSDKIFKLLTNNFSTTKKMSTLWLKFFPELLKNTSFQAEKFISFLNNQIHRNFEFFFARFSLAKLSRHTKRDFPQFHLHIHLHARVPKHISKLRRVLKFPRMSTTFNGI